MFKSSQKYACKVHKISDDHFRLSDLTKQLMTFFYKKERGGRRAGLNLLAGRMWPPG